MKTIGLIGGISWQSTLKVKKYQMNDDWDSLNILMAEAAQSLKDAGAEMLMIGANTMHLTAPYIIEHVDIDLVHIVDAVGEKIKVTSRCYCAGRS